jgi:hypothetical protein
MKKAKQELPPGFTVKKIRRVISFYDAQPPEEAIIEAETGLKTQIGVPADLLDDVRRYVAKRISDKRKTA